jgi:hypothetical protein
VTLTDGKLLAIGGSGNQGTLATVDVLGPSVNQDTTAPVITVPTDITAEATSAGGAVVNFTVSATDDVDPNPTLTASPASGSTFPLGTTTVTGTATDAHGNSASRTFTVTVRYSWAGYRQPINEDGSSIFKQGSTVPVKFQLTGASVGITDAVARLYYAKVSEGIEGTYLEAVSTASATTGNLFRLSGGQYVFNLGTSDLSEGTYRLKVDLGDGEETRMVTISLK